MDDQPSQAGHPTCCKEAKADLLHARDSQDGAFGHVLQVRVALLAKDPQIRLSRIPAFSGRKDGFGRALRPAESAPIALLIHRDVEGRLSYHNRAFRTALFAGLAADPTAQPSDATVREDLRLPHVKGPFRVLCRTARFPSQPKSQGPSQRTLP